MRNLTLATVVALLASPVLADDLEGDVENGEVQFGRQCVTCHVVIDDDGEVLAGRNARTGPNLYGVVGRHIGTVEDFRYGDALIALGERGDTWTEEAFVGYVQDPTAWLRETLEDRRARGKMAFQVRDEQTAHDLYAYLASLAPAAE